MKVGDLVIRKVQDLPDWKLRPAIIQRERLGHGLILSRQWAGQPGHRCITVFYPKTGEIYDIAESLMEVLYESGRV
tara:strand:- start:29 stop:256 length:228 start_codon:yes stop_codon:yes gene_type:complete